MLSDVDELYLVRILNGNCYTIALWIKNRKKREIAAPFPFVYKNLSTASRLVAFYI